jgi:hypothetical protein
LGCSRLLILILLELLLTALYTVTSSNDVCAVFSRFTGYKSPPAPGAMTSIVALTLLSIQKHAHIYLSIESGERSGGSNVESIAANETFRSTHRSAAELTNSSECSYNWPISWLRYAASHRRIAHSQGSRMRSSRGLPQQALQLP